MYRHPLSVTHNDCRDFQGSREHTTQHLRCRGEQRYRGGDLRFTCRRPRRRLAPAESTNTDKNGGRPQRPPCGGAPQTPPRRQEVCMHVAERPLYGRRRGHQQQAVPRDRSRRQEPLRMVRQRRRRRRVRARPLWHGGQLGGLRERRQRQRARAGDDGDDKTQDGRRRRRVAPERDDREARVARRAV